MGSEMCIRDRSKTSEMINKELEPTLIELKETLGSINSIAKNTDEQIEKLNNAPHYMVCDNNTTEQRHGLGLLIVKQIVSAHGGTTVIEHSIYGGFVVKITLPINNCDG